MSEHRGNLQSEGEVVGRLAYSSFWLDNINILLILRQMRLDRCKILMRFLCVGNLHAQ